MAGEWDKSEGDVQEQRQGERPDMAEDHDMGRGSGSELDETAERETSEEERRERI
jgi:hypothetical protein